MKQLLGYFKAFFKETFNLGYFLFLACFLTGIVWFNYHYDFENTVIEAYARQPIYNLYVFLFYAFPYFVALIAYTLFYKKLHLLKSVGLWSLSLFAMVVLTINETFFMHKTWIEEHIDPQIGYFVLKTANNLVSALIYLITVTVYWYFQDRKNFKLYGFSAKEFNLRPYLWMYAIMIPLIIWASYQESFQQAYPNFPMAWGEVFSDYTGLSHTHSFLIYEFAYGSDFVFLEFFFRGFLVLAFIKYLDKGAIFPMVALYCLYHFGKPMPEAVSSIFGGMALGILSYYTRSIYGGILIHLGVAYSMEFAAIIQHRFLSVDF